MFDDFKGQNTGVVPPAGSAPLPGTIPENKPNIKVKEDLNEARRELDDIFNDVSPAGPQETAKPSVFMPKSTQPLAILPPENSRLHKLIIPLIAVVGLSLAVVGGYFGYRYVVGKMTGIDTGIKTENEAVPTPEEEAAPAAEDTAAAPAPVQPTGNEGPAFAGSEPDTDADGLTDAEEAALGTNTQNVDTDGDGLFDREEAKVFKTDPLNPDSDKDGFTDGNEVRDGFNPNGEGRLYEVKSE